MNAGALEFGFSGGVFAGHPMSPKVCRTGAVFSAAPVSLFSQAKRNTKMFPSDTRQMGQGPTPRLGQPTRGQARSSGRNWLKITSDEGTQQ
jgi:hypothetical protein